MSKDTTLSIGETIRVGIQAIGQGANITYFHIGWNNGQPETVLDSGMNQPALLYDISITKTASASEDWMFLVMDRDRNTSSRKLTIHRDTSSQYKPIRAISNILLGAQNNPTAGSFFSITEEAGYTLDEAYQHQDLIDILYYFDQYDATLSSPAEADAPALFPGPAGLANWTIKNETRYDTTAITPAAFDLSANDSLILSAYDPVNLKRKAKYVLPGMIISFRDSQGKLGLMHVKEVLPGADGSILFDLKVQQ